MAIVAMAQNDISLQVRSTSIVAIVTMICAQLADKMGSPAHDQPHQRTCGSSAARRPRASPRSGRASHSGTAPHGGGQAGRMTGPAGLPRATFLRGRKGGGGVPVLSVPVSLGCVIGGGLLLF